MALTDVERLRSLLGDEIPEQGSEDDALFSEDKLQDLLDSNSTVNLAAAEGWRIKAAMYADLVDTQEGTSKRAMSDLHKNALAMANGFDPPDSNGPGDPVKGVTRVHGLVRR